MKMKNKRKYGVISEDPESCEHNQKTYKDFKSTPRRKQKFHDNLKSFRIEEDNIEHDPQNRALPDKILREDAKKIKHRLSSVTTDDPASEENSCGDQMRKDRVSKRTVCDLRLYFSTKDSMIPDLSKAKPPVPNSLKHNKPSPAAKTRPKRLIKSSKLPSKCNNQPPTLNYLKSTPLDLERIILKLKVAENRLPFYKCDQADKFSINQ